MPKMERGEARGSIKSRKGKCKCIALLHIVKLSGAKIFALRAFTGDKPINYVVNL